MIYINTPGDKKMNKTNLVSGDSSECAWYGFEAIPLESSADTNPECDGFKL